MDDEEFVDEAEMAEANDPNVGAGTPETAPREAVFDDDDDLDDDGEEDGGADDGDDDAVDDPDDTEAVDGDI